MKTQKKITILIIMIIIFGWVTVPLCFEFRDSLGRKVTLQARPERIVSLAPSLTEILFFLGLGKKVVGVTQFSDYPPEANLKPKVGSYINLNVEKIISLSPDLVIGTADGNKSGIVDILAQAGIPVYIINPRNIRDVIKVIDIIGKVCGMPDKAHSLSKQLSGRVEFVREKSMNRKSPLVFLQINLKPIMTVNRNTFHHDLIRVAGGINMAGDEPVTYPRISLEEVIRRKPEIIIISSMERGGRFEKARMQWLKWTSIPAVKNKRVHNIESDLIDRPSPRIIKGLEAMSRIIHPEIK